LRGLTRKSLTGFNNLQLATALLMALAVGPMAPTLAGAQAPDSAVELIEGCKWRDQTISVSSTPVTKLTFRWQDCDGENAAKVRFALDAENTLVQSWDGANVPVAQFWPLAGRPAHELIETVASPSVGEAERGHCHVHLDYVSRHYNYEPNAAYMEELLSKDEPFHACGTFGETNDGIQYFAVIGGKILAYFWIGQDIPLFDPDSFKITQ